MTANKDLTKTREVRKMLNGDGYHYDVTDEISTFGDRYFLVRGDSEMAKTFKSLVSNTTPYNVADFEAFGDRFRAKIVHEDADVEFGS